MPPTIKRGQIATSDVLAAQLVVDMDRTVYQIDPQAAPALTILPASPAARKRRRRRSTGWRMSRSPCG